MTTWDRCAEWADLYGLPALATILLGVDLGTGLNWLLSPPADLSGPVYDPAKMLAPMWAYGVVFLVLSVLAIAALLTRWRSWLAGYTVHLLAAAWAFWAVLFGAAAAGPHTSWQGTIQAIGLALLHFLCGFAVAHPAPDRRG